MKLGLPEVDGPSLLDLFFDAEASIDNFECDIAKFETNEDIIELSECIGLEGFTTSLESLYGDELNDLGIITSVSKEELASKVYELSEEAVPLMINPVYGAILLTIAGILYGIRNHTQNMVALSDKFDIDRIPAGEWELHENKNVTCVDAKVAITGLKWAIRALTALTKLDPNKEIDDKIINKITFGVGISVDAKGKVKAPRTNVYNTSLKKHGWNKESIKEVITLIKENRKLIDSTIKSAEILSKKIKKGDKAKQIRTKEARIIKGIIVTASKMVGIASKSWLRVIKVSPNVRESLKGK